MNSTAEYWQCFNMSHQQDIDALHTLTTQCAWCFDPSAETVAVQVGDEGTEIELDLCSRHVNELLEGSRPAP
jgi:hypothetical protein